jgi:hypothetical protein
VVGLDASTCWLFITPLCGMGFCNTTGGGVVSHSVAGPAGEQVVLRDVVHFYILSSV